MEVIYCFLKFLIESFPVEGTGGRVGGLGVATVSTIGHSNHTAVEFVRLLKKNNIEVIIDVRSKPYSSYSRHFNREALRRRLKGYGIEYLYLGDRLGGHPESDEFYEEGRVVYERLAALPEFRRDIRKVVEESEKHRLTLMCAEENPSQCHRHTLLATALLERGLKVIHIRGSGTTQDASEMTEGDKDNEQIPLFETPGEDLSWQSPKRIR